MNHMFKKIFSVASLLSTGMMLADSCSTGCNVSCNDTLTQVTTCFLPRSQGRDLVKKTAGLDPDHEHLFDIDNIYGTFNIGVEYTQSFSNNKIAECLFGPAVFRGATSASSTLPGFCNSCPSDCDDSVTIRVVGTEAPTPANGTTDLLANNFFLPADFSSTITFSPKISNVNIPLQLYIGLDEWCNGMYFRLYGPVTYTRWKLEANEVVVNAGTIGSTAGGISPEAVPATNLYQNFLDYTSGGSISLPTSTPTVTVDRLAHQRILAGCDAQTKTGFADLRAELGWDFLLDECYHLGINIQAAAPTGNGCNDCLLFGPIVGNGKHWELGGGVTGHLTLWQSEDAEQQFDFYVDADITHMFKHSEDRVFDLKNKPLSRYIIAERMTTADTLLEVNGAATNLQFAGSYAPVANFAVQSVDVSFNVQADVLAKFVYTCRGFGWEVGYNFWGRSCEKVETNCDCGVQFSANTWALTCDRAFGFETNTDTPHAIGATTSGTTAFACAAIDNTNADVTFNGIDLVETPNTITPRINGSTTSITIAQTDLDIRDGARGISNKVYTHFNYTWIDCEDCIPYIGIGGSAEFGANKDRGSISTSSTSTTTTSCDNDCSSSCSDCSLSQWAIWIKGGISFN